MTNFDLSGAANRAASEMPGEWELKSQLSPHLSMKDNEEAKRNPCVVWKYSKPAARTPSVRWCTKEDLNDPEICAILNDVGIDDKKIVAAKKLFEPSNVVILNTQPPRLAVFEEGTGYRQMAAGHGHHGPQRG